jgi:hypothetical protein
MAKKDYVPSREPEQIPWSTNLKAKIAIHGATVGLSAGDITAVQGNCDTVKDSLETFEQAKRDFQEASNTKDADKNPAIRSIREFAQRIKKNAAYTTAIGEDLGIIGDEQTVDVANSQPELKYSKVPSGHEFKFNLKGFFAGVNIYKKLPSAASFTFLARDTSSPYIDTTTVENGTQYYAYFVLGDTEVGQRSAIVTVGV